MPLLVSERGTRLVKMMSCFQAGGSAQGHQGGQAPPQQGQQLQIQHGDPADPSWQEWVQHGWCRICNVHADDSHMGGRRHKKVCGQTPLAWRDSWSPVPDEWMQWVSQRATQPAAGRCKLRYSNRAARARPRQHRHQSQTPSKTWSSASRTWKRSCRFTQPMILLAGRNRID